MHRDSYYGTGQDPNAYGTTDNLLFVADSQVNQYVGRHTISWGGQYTWEDLLDEQPAYARLTDATYRNVGLLLQDDWAFAKGWGGHLWFSGRQALRGESSHRLPTPGAHDLAARVVGYPSINRARLPGASGVRRRFASELGGGEVRFIRIDPGLREETSTNYMLGAEWKPEAGRGQALLEVNGFLTSLNDLFLSRNNDDPNTDPLEFLKVNHGHARVYGAEMNVGWGVDDDFVLQGGLVLQRARFGEPEPDFGSSDFFRTPTRYGNLTMTWRTAGLGTMFAAMRYTGPMKAPHFAGFIDHDRLETTPSFVTLDAGVAYPLYAAGTRRFTLTVAGRNLTNAFQPDPDQGPLRDANYVYGPRFPRAFSVGLRAEF
jgi:outer membrane receptor for ferrienterochelin and colicins